MCDFLKVGDIENKEKGFKEKLNNESLINTNFQENLIFIYFNKKSKCTFNIGI